ncbi:MAG: hypothetical protein FWE16_05010 [Firmicutes bacterium]|nr:hypothetical protein [Bacillota bacterium]
MWENGIPTLDGCSGIDKEHPQPSLTERLTGYKKRYGAPHDIFGLDLPPYKLSSIIANRLITNNPQFAYCSLMLTDDTRDKIASLLENLLQEDKEKIFIGFRARPDLKSVSFSIEDPKTYRQREKFIDKTFLANPDKVNNTENQAEEFFARLNILFERAKEKGLSSDMSIREFKNDLEAERSKQTESGKEV